MAKRDFLVSIDLNDNQLLNPVIHNYGQETTLPASTVTGKLIYHTNGATRELYINDGTNWLKIPSGTVTAAEGGTGQSSYTIGDILYASSTSALSKLAGVATGNALISGGVGAAPSWGKISLTTHVSGILPVANGGTGVSSIASGEAVIGAGTGNITTRGITNTTTNFIGGTASANLITFNTLLNYNGRIDLPWNVTTITFTNGATTALLSVDTTSPGYLKVNKGFYSEGAISAYGISGGGAGGGLVTSIDSWAYLNAQVTNPYATDAGSTVVVNAYAAYEILAKVKALEAGSATTIADGTITGPFITSITKSGTTLTINKEAVTSAQIYAGVTNPTGTGLLVFATSPTFTTSILGGSSFSAFTSSSTLTLGYTGTASSTLNISTGAAANGTTKIVNLATGGATGSITQINVGANTTSSYVTVSTPTLNFNGSAINTTSTSLNVFNSTVNTVNAFGGASNLTLGNTSGTTTIRTSTVTLSNAALLNIDGASPTLASTNTGTLTLFNSNLTTVNAFGAATSLTLGGSNSNATINLGAGGTLNGNTKTVNIGTGGVAGSTTTLNLGSLVSTTSINLNGNATVSGNLLVTGNLTVDGIVTAINSSTLTVDDKNIELGSVASKTGLGATLVAGNTTVTLTTGTTAGMIPGQLLSKTSGTGVFGTNAVVAAITSTTQFTVTVAHATAGAIVFSVGGVTNVTADGGGITLKGVTDKTILWLNATSSWDMSEHLNIAADKYYRVGGVDLFTISSNEIVAGSTITNIKIGSQVLARKYTGDIIGGVGVKTFVVLHTLVNVVAQIVDVNGTLVECEVITAPDKTTFNFNNDIPTTGLGPYRYIIIG